MKKIYSLVAAVICVSGLNAQVLTQANHAPIVGDVYQTVNCSTVGAVPGGNGTGQTWNFSTLSVLTTTTTNNGVTVASTGSAAAYPSASVAVTSGTNGTSFYSSSASNLMYWGGNIIVGGQAVTMSYTQAAIHASYPMVFGTTANGNISGTASHTLAGSGPFAGTCTVTATGAGTLMLPGGYNFSNVLKITTVKAITFTVAGTGTYSQTVTDYYSPLSKYPLFTISNEYINSALGTTTETVAIINNNYTALGIKDASNQTLNNVSVYPNPAKDNININFTNENAENASYELVNVLGQTVRTQAIPVMKGETLYNVNLTGVENGVYFVKLNVGSKTSIKKITVQ